MLLLPLLLVTICLGCGDSKAPASAPPAVTPVMDRLAESYVKVALAIEAHDPGHIVAYWGPSAWPAEVAASPRSLADIRLAALPLVAQLEELQATGQDLLRRDYLLQQLQALTARAEVLDGVPLTFEDEALLIYGVRLPAYVESESQARLGQIGGLLARRPGAGGSGLTGFEQAHMVPADRIEAVFNSVVAEAKRRTGAFVASSAQDSLDFHGYLQAPEPAVTRYQGDSFSIIQIDVGTPLPVGRVFDLAVRAAYPGHHLFAHLRDQNLAAGRGWVEHTVVTRYSPQWTMAEALSAYGPELAFSREIRSAFQRDILFPLAGLPAEDVAQYDDIYTLLGSALDHLTLEAARRHLDGEMTLDEAARWLAARATLTPEHARRELDFAEAHRGYVLGRSIGRDMVREYLQGRAGSGASIERRWSIYQELIASPYQPSGLVRTPAPAN